MDDKRLVAILVSAILILAGLTSVSIIRLFDQAATQGQLGHVQADSCHVFAFVEKRFLVPTTTQTSEQQQITAQFAGALRQAVADCTKAGYG